MERPRSSRRLSWADAQGLHLELAIPPVALEPGESSAEQADAYGEHTVDFGIIQIGALYGIYVPLPRVVRADLLEHPAPGLAIQVATAEDGTVSLWVTYEVNAEGRHSATCKLRLEGVPELPELRLNVKAQCMSRRDGRPSRLRPDVHLLRQAPPEVDPSAGAEWQASKEILATEVDEEEA